MYNYYFTSQGADLVGCSNPNNNATALSTIIIELCTVFRRQTYYLHNIFPVQSSSHFLYIKTMINSSEVLMRTGRGDR